MKKILTFVLVSFLIFCNGISWAVESVVPSKEEFGNPIGIITVTFDVTCAADGSMTATEIPATIISYMEQNNFCLLKMQTIDAAAPEVTDDSDIYLRDSNGIDLLGGAGVDALDSNTTAPYGREVLAAIGSSTILQPVTDTLTFYLTTAAGNANDDFKVIFYFVVKP